MQSQRSPYIKHIYVCTKQREAGEECCAGDSSQEALEKLKAYVKEHNLKGRVRVSQSGCMDFCSKGGNVMVYPDHRWYHSVKPEDVDTIIERELMPLAKRYGKQQDQPQQSEIKVFFFDLGNVLVKFNHMHSALKIARHSTALPDSLFELFFESPIVTDHDEGRVSTRKFYEIVKESIGLTIDYPEFVDIWNHIFEENTPMVDLLRQLLKKYPCFLISNTNRAHFEYIRETYDFLDDMTGWVLSYEVGHLKPHPAIFNRALDMAEVQASDAFYIDDRQDLIDAAQELGLPGHRFAGINPLVEDLRNRGVEI